MINFRELPFYIQFTFKLLMLLLLCVFVKEGQTVVVPFIFSILLSILLLPVTNFFEHKINLPKSLSTFISVILALAIIGGLIYFFSQQISSFLEDIPTLKKNLQTHYETIQKWIQKRFGISSREQTEMINNATADVQDSGSVISKTVFTITNTLFYIILVAIYSFLILYYRHMIKRFIFAIFVKAKEPEINEVLLESKGIVQNYMLGLVIEMGIVAAANSLVLLLIGVKYPIFLGVFSAILNIIPYVGILSGIIFTVLVTLTTSKDISDIIWIIISFEIIHFIDSNFLMPRIVGSKVRVNALITFLGVVIGGTLIGLPGIFLALPVIAILKIIFDRIEDLKPWGMIMGDDTERGEIYRRIEKINLIRRKKSLPPIPVPPLGESPGTIIAADTPGADNEK
ncbi:MAG: AI-2E family transporter [Ferruginibacter sp.]